MLTFEELVVGERLVRARLPRGAAPPTPPSRTSALRGSWPTHPPSDFLDVGAAPPRPRPAARPQPAALSVIPAKAGIHPGHRRGPAPAGRQTPGGRTAPPFPWGLRPHAPTRSAGLRRRRTAPPFPSHRAPLSVAPRPPFRHSGESRNPSGASEGVRRPPADKPPRAHRAPLARIRPNACGGTPQPTRHNPPPATPAPRIPEWIVEGGCGGEPPLETTAPEWIVEGGCGGEPPLETTAPPLRTPESGRTPPRPLQTEVARTASGPPPLTRGRPRALLHMCRVSPPGRSASHGAPRHGAGGTAGFQRNRPAGRRLWRPARATAQARQPGPPRNGSPIQGGLSGRTTRNATTQRVPP